MRMNRLTRRFTAWIACLAILAAALAPSISHALAAANSAGSFSNEICSTTDLKLVKTANEQDPASPSPAGEGMSFDHCPFCFTHAGSFGLPPVSSVTLPVVSGLFPLPSLYYQSPRPLFVWATAQSRAPPFHS
jgi:hypothetical protein